MPGGPWTQDKCIEYALIYNIDNKRQELVRETREVAVCEGRWAYSPSSHIRISRAGSSGRVLARTTYEFIKNSIVESGNFYIGAAGFVFRDKLSIFTKRIEREKMTEFGPFIRFYIDLYWPYRVYYKRCAMFIQA